MDPPSPSKIQLELKTARIPQKKQLSQIPSDLKPIDESPQSNYTSDVSLPKLPSSEDLVPSDIKALFGDFPKDGGSSRIYSQINQPSFLSDHSFFGEEVAAAGSYVPKKGDPFSSEVHYYSPKGDFQVLEFNQEIRIREVGDFNTICPFCGESVAQDVIDPTRALALVAGASRRQYLLHKSCYLQSASNMNAPKIITNLPLFEPRINFSQVPTFPFNRSNFVLNEKKGCFVTIEGFHPVSSLCYFKIEKILCIQQHLLRTTECLFFDFEAKSTNIFEPSAYSIPYNEFRVVLTLFIPHIQKEGEEPFQFEFLLDFSSLPSNEPMVAEALFCHQGNNISLTFDIQREFKKEKTLSIKMKSVYVGVPPRRAFSPNESQEKVVRHHPVSSSSLVKTEEQYGIHSPSTTSSKTFDYNYHNKHVKPHSVTSIQTSTQPTMRGGPSTTVSSMSDISPYFRFGQRDGHRERLRANTFKDAHLHPSSLSGQEGYGYSENYLRYDDSPLLGPRALEASIRKGSAPNYPIEGSFSDHFSMSKYGGGQPLSRIPTLMSEADSLNLGNSPKTVKSIKSLYGSELDQQLQSIPDIEQQQCAFRIEDNLGMVEELAKSYQGSKVIQQFISKASQQEIDLLIQEISGKIEELILDPYANYMVQSLMQSCSSEQRYRLLKKIAPSMIKIACHKKGTHSLQVIVTLMHKEAEHEIIRDALKDYISDLAVDPCATHVIQKLITIIPIDNIGFIYEPIVRDFISIAKHSYGILVIKHLMIKVESIAPLKKRIIDLILDNFEELIQDPCGNYTIQYSLEFYPNDCETILEKILVRVISYSSQKFSSNVIEKCLANAQPQYLKRVIGEIMKSDRLADLMKNKYGNYVLLHVLIASDRDDRERIMQGIYKYTNSFHGTKYKERWSEFLQENPLGIEWSGSKFGEIVREEPIIVTPEPRSHGIKQADLEKVKKVWRSMNKKERKDSSQPNIETTSKPKTQQNYNVIEQSDFNYGNRYHQNIRRGGNASRGKKDSRGRGYQNPHY